MVQALSCRQTFSRVQFHEAGDKVLGQVPVSLPWVVRSKKMFHVAATQQQNSRNRVPPRRIVAVLPQNNAITHLRNVLGFSKRSVCGLSLTLSSFLRLCRPPRKPKQPTSTKQGIRNHTTRINIHRLTVGHSPQNFGRRVSRRAADGCQHIGRVRHDFRDSKVDNDEWRVD